MARGVALNKDGRQRLAGVLRALLIAQLSISLLMVIYCYNTSYKVMSLLKKTHKVTIYLIYVLILLQAYCMKLHYTSGFRLITWLLRCPHWRRAAPVTRLWLISGTLLAANGLLVHAACKSTMKALMKELSSSLRVGMSQYLTEPFWKQLIDTMQVELNCCGVDSPNDWHEVPWINIDFLNEDSELVMKLSGVDGKVLPPVSPYSCCSPYVSIACFHDPLQQSHGGGAGSLQARGCVSAAHAPVARAARALRALTLLALLLQVVIVAVTQCVRNAALRDTHQAQQMQQAVPCLRARERCLRARSFPNFPM